MTAYSPAARKKGRFAAYMKQNFWLYIFLIPGMVFLLLMNYLPMFGIIIAFKNFRVVKGVFGSDWVGLKHFQYLFHAPDFYRILRNSLTLSLLRLVCGFPMPIILALMMNEMGNQGYKRTMQTILYLPHFLSWVIISSLTVRLFGTYDGLVNKLMGTEIPFISTESNWRTTYIVLGIWKECGWNTIIYLAALTGISPELYEAAEVDGASRWRKIWHITLPGIRSTIIVLLIMNLGRILGSEFDRPFTLSNKLVEGASKTISIYVYERGVKGGQYPLSTAVGLFQSVICVIFLVISNTLAKKFGERGIW